MKINGKKKVMGFLFFLGTALFLFAQNDRELRSYGDDNLILIRGGVFSMGSPESELWREPDETLHRVRVDSFYISRYEVTQAEYEEITGENPSSFSGPGLPVEGVSWYDALSFCNALSRRENRQPVYRISGRQVLWDRGADGYRLPTEAEWEYACRAGTSTPFNKGDSVAAEEVNYFGYYPYTVEDHYFDRYEMETPPGIYREKTVPVDSFEPNSWGLYQMHGNVSEWCFDSYGNYDGVTAVNPSGPAEGFLRLTRGGGWNDFAKHLRSAYRAATPPDDRFYSRGFRIVRNGE